MDAWILGREDAEEEEGRGLRRALQQRVSADLKYTRGPLGSPFFDYST